MFTGMLVCFSNLILLYERGIRKLILTLNKNNFEVKSLFSQIKVEKGIL